MKINYQLYNKYIQKAPPIMGCLSFEKEMLREQMCKKNTLYFSENIFNNDYTFFANIHQRETACH